MSALKERRRLSNRACAIALAASVLLPAGSAARAQDWVEYHEPGAYSVMFPGQPEITKESSRPESPLGAFVRAGSFDGRIVMVFVAVFLGGVEAGFGWFLLRAARRRYMRRIGQKVLRDTRKPYVFLRPFTTDDRGIRADNAGARALRFLSLRLYKAVWYPEQIFAERAGRRGPVLAIGSPAMRLPSIGAAKIYADDAHWHEAVEEICEHSDLTVIRVGHTPGLHWEIGLLSEKLRHSVAFALLFCDLDGMPSSSQAISAYLKSIPVGSFGEIPPKPNLVWYLLFTPGRPMELIESGLRVDRRPKSRLLLREDFRFATDRLLALPRGGLP